MHEGNNILIVDDEQQNIETLTDILCEDYTIITAQTGEQALAAVQGTNPPDLILVDTVMPGMDGYEVCASLQSESRTKHIPIILITPLDVSDDEARIFEVGAVDYITKPFQPLTVQARVKTNMELKRKTDLLERMAVLDSLTEIPNSRCFDTTLKQEICRVARSGSFLSLILMDIDFFKRYNDHYGHASANACLQKVAKALKGVAKRAPDFVARCWGEEFVMILPGTDREGAIHVAEEVRRAVAELNIQHAASEVAEHVSLSLGVATILGDRGVTPVGLIEKADASLSQAKEKGRNQVFSLPE